MSAPSSIDRLHDLLADRALHGLDPLEQLECDGLLAAHPQVDADSLDLLVAEIQLAGLSQLEARKLRPS